MTIQNFLMVLTYAAGLGAFIIVGRSSLKKQTISDQASLILALQSQNLNQAGMIKGLQDQNKKQADEIDGLTNRVRFLEDLVWSGRTSVVDQGPPPGNGGGRRRGGTASAAPSENEGDG